MELRQLRYFESIVKYGTMRESAAKLFISEPAISQQINELQKEIGVPLFEKQGRKIALTSEGKQLLPLVQSILEAVTKLGAGISEIRNCKYNIYLISAAEATWTHLIDSYSLSIIPNR